MLLHTCLLFILGLSEFLVLPSTSIIPTNKVLASTSAAPIIWSNNQTKVLLDLYQKYRPKVGTREIKTLKKLWEILACELNRLLEINVTESHTENRWRVLERAYKKYVDNQNKTGQGTKYFEYKEEMDQIFRGKKNVNPVVLLSTASIEPTEEDDKSEETIGYLETPKASTVESSQKKSINLKRKRTPVQNRNLILAHMKQDRKEYQEERLKIEKEKLKFQQRKAEAMEERNILIKERNEILKKQKCIVCSQEIG